ncbi:MAG: polysaccharide biosynthesis tyrosine autokinase [Flavobacteriales bacterium]|jgi:capsular exopolysaccharide synthesis family protein|nr:polysaccharide biosynthesis tyrosine autokinase [Flavobacteriales bacterium]
MIRPELSQRHLNFESYRERITNFSNEFDLGLFVHILRRSLVWIALCLVLAVATALIYLRYTAEIHESYATLQLRKSNTAAEVLSMTAFTEADNLNVDVELMRSRYFLARVLQRLPVEVSYFRRGQILTEETYRSSPYQWRDLEVLDAGVRDVPVQIDLSRPGRVALAYTVAGRTHEVEAARHERITTPHFTGTLAFPQGEWIEEKDTRTTPYFRINSTGALLARFAKQVRVAVADPQAKTVEIRCRDANMVLARDLAQAMAETFIDFDLERQSESAENIIRFIRTQKDTVFNELRESELRLQTFKMENRVADMDRLTPIHLERSRAFEDEIVELTMELALLKEVARATDKPPAEVSAFDLLPLLVGTDFEASVGRLLGSLQELLDQRTEIYLEATAEHQAVINLERRIEVQKQMILSGVRTLQERTQDRLDEITGQLHAFEDSFLALPEKQLQFARIDRVFGLNEKYYTQLLEKEIQYRISRAGFVSENRILQDAGVNPVPVSPQRDMVFITCLAAGLVVCLIIVLTLYIVHDNITSLHDVAKLSNASIGILGMVPMYKKEIPISQLLIDKNPKSLIAESFRSIRTNLQFVDNSTGPKLVAITSTISGEGKTFVAINLAGIIAYSGKRVIILDLDMRKPKIHLGFGVENTKGMSTLLIGRHTLEETVQHSGLEGLDFVTAGPIPPNPSELIISEPMDRVLDQLLSEYDVVLVDNPPVGLVTDGLPMIQRADYPIYIFRADYSKKQFIQNVDRLINENDITKLSCILNGVDIDRSKYGYNYGYGYGYGYGQGYGGGYYEEQPARGLWATLLGKDK